MAEHESVFAAAVAAVRPLLLGGTIRDAERIVLAVLRAAHAAADDGHLLKRAEAMEQLAAANERAKTAEAERDRYASAYHRLDSDQAAAGSYAMRAERAEDERDKARARLAELGRPIRDRIEAKVRPAMLLGLQDAELYGEPGAQRIGEWVDWIADTLTEADTPAGPGEESSHA